MNEKNYISTIHNLCVNLYDICRETGRMDELHGLLSEAGMETEKEFATYGLTWLAEEINSLNYNPSVADAEYADWCLTNNWMKLDNEAGIYVCGERLFDEEWEEWIENDIRRSWCKKYCDGMPGCQKGVHCLFAREI